MKRISLATKLFIVMCGLAVAASGATIALLNAAGQYALREQVKAGLASSASAAAAVVDGDAVARLQDRSDETSQTFLVLKRQLRRLKDSHPDLQHVYLLRRVQDADVMSFVVGSDHHGSIGDIYEYANASLALEGYSRETVGITPVHMPWGMCLSAYAPIKDSSGRIVAILGVDMSARRFKEHNSSIVAAAAFSLVLALMLVLILGHMLANRLTKPVRTLTAAARRVAEDDLEQCVPVSSNDEIGDLAATFNSMVESVRTVRAKLVERANRDALTDLFNHRYFHERLSAEASRASRYGHEFCLIILDVDHFKQLNDTYGHPVGDFVLTRIAHIISSVTRDIDVVARYGGDEFAVIMPETDLKGAIECAERIRNGVAEKAFDYGIGELLTTTVSLGVAEYPKHHDKTDGLVMAADIALFRAKHTSRNRAVVYEPIAKGDSPIDPYELHKMLHDPNVTAIETLAAAVDARDKYTHGHSERVTEYSMQIAAQMGMYHEEQEIIKVAGLLHDVGKIGVPDSILNKPSELSTEERALIQNHPSLGAKIVGRAPQLENVIPGILHHHERFDGSGYPDKLAGEDIPIIARILAVADSYDAMTSKRPYRDAMPVSVAVSELLDHSGTQFDPQVVEAFLKTIQKRGAEAA